MFQTDKSEPRAADTPAHQIDPLLRWDSVHSLTGMKRSLAYAEMAAGRFPRPVQISAKSVAWKASEIAAWIDSRPKVSA